MVGSIGRNSVRNSVKNNVKNNVSRSGADSAKRIFFRRLVRSTCGAGCAAFLLLGCGPDRRIAARAAVVANRPADARQAINAHYSHRASDDGEGDQRLDASRHLLLWRLERAAIELDAGRPLAALDHLQEASRLAREARTRSASRALSAAVVNDNLTRWTGEAPELIRIPAYGLLAHLAVMQAAAGIIPGERDSERAALHADRAASAALALEDQLDRLRDGEFGSDSYHDDAWLHVLAAMGLHAVAATADDAETVRLFTTRAEEAYAKSGGMPSVVGRLLPRLRGEALPPPGFGSILLLEDSGWAPLRQALSLTIVTAAPGNSRSAVDLGGVFIVVDGPGREQLDPLIGLILPGSLIRDLTRGSFGVFGCDIPVLPALGAPSRLGQVEGQVDHTSLEAVDDIAGKVQRAFMDGQKRRVGAIIVRTAVKLIAARQGVNAVEAAGDRKHRAESEAIGNILWFLLSGLIRVSEQADTRCWSLLPGRTGAALLDVPAGLTTVTVQTGDGSQRTFQNIHVEAGKLVVLTVRSFPQGTAVPERK